MVAPATWVRGSQPVHTVPGVGASVTTPPPTGVRVPASYSTPLGSTPNGRLCCGSSWPGASTTSSTGCPRVWAQLLAMPLAAASASQVAPDEPGPVSPLTG